MENIIGKTLEIKKTYYKLLFSKELKKEMWRLVCKYMDWPLDIKASIMIVEDMRLDVHLIDEHATYQFLFKMNCNGNYYAILNFRKKNE